MCNSCEVDEKNDWRFQLKTRAKLKAAETRRTESAWQQWRTEGVLVMELSMDYNVTSTRSKEEEEEEEKWMLFSC